MKSSDVYLEYSRSPKLNIDIRYLAGELHGRGHHVHALPGVLEAQEDVTQQHEAAGGQPVQILSVGHLERLSEVSLALVVL